MDELRLFGTRETDLAAASRVIETSGRIALADVRRVPRRWSGGLHRTTQARAIRGSNTIEGHTVSEQDAVGEEPPLSADERAHWAEVIGYRRVLTVIDALIARHGLPERTGAPLFEAIPGYRVRRPG